MFALTYAQRYPAQVGGIVLLDSMHPNQDNAFAGTDRVLAVVPTLARMGLARVFSDPKKGKPTTQASQFARDVHEMPAELNRAAKLASLGDRPLAVLTAGTGSAASLGCRTKRPRQSVEHQRSPHRRRRDAPVAHRRQERRDSIEPRHRRGRHSGAEEAWLIPMRPTASTRRLATP
jgi:pimeloyl-ACP methyl ester carboxylesterase